MQYNRTAWQATLPNTLLSDTIQEGLQGLLGLSRRLRFAFGLMGDSVISSLVILETF